jgi:hypothetical protein
MCRRQPRPRMPSFRLRLYPARRDGFAERVWTRCRSLPSGDIQRDSTKVLDQPPRAARSIFIGLGEPIIPKYRGYVYFNV